VSCYRRIIFGLALTCLVACAGHSVRTGDNGLAPYHPDYQRMTLKNGLRVIVVPRHDLPTLNLGWMSAVGAREDSEFAGPGVVSLTAHLLERGTVKKSALQMAEELGNLGAHFSVDVTHDYSWFELEGLSKNSEKIAHLFQEILLEPSLPEGELRKLKAQTLANIDQTFDEAEDFAEIAFQRELFSARGYGLPVFGTKTALESLQRKNLQAAYRELVNPTRSILVVTGDFDEDFLRRIESVFEKEPARAPKAEPVWTAPEGVESKTILVDHPGSPQADLVMGFKTIPRNHPDYLKLKIANLVLGGAFSSRLNDRIREKLGLTYHIASEVVSFKAAGIFEISTFTKNESLRITLDEAQRVLAEFIRDGLTGPELHDAQNYLVGQFSRAVETPEGLAFNLALLTVYGVSDSHVTSFREYVQSINREEIHNVVKERWAGQPLLTFIYGSKKALGVQLKALGPIQEVSARDFFK